MRFHMRLPLVPIVALALLWGCAGAQKPPAPLPTNATSPADAQTYRVLNDAHAFLSSVRDSVASGKLTLTAAQKTAFNSLILSSNAADALWQQCHAGGCSAQQQTQLMQQTNTLNANLAAAQSQIAVKP